jgi:hypothetical protein
MGSVCGNKVCKPKQTVNTECPAPHYITYALAWTACYGSIRTCSDKLCSIMCTMHGMDEDCCQNSGNGESGQAMEDSRR